jgi:hypothetical protein
MPNRLAEQTSPYLLQHRDNPVDWLPWGPEARGLAAERDVPILLSIGYSACHWCHVMERESFEDEATAAFMNEHFVPIKVDREERPDVDAIYMEAVQAMTGHGGWPMTVFLDPEGVPFYGGTYFPPEPRAGMPSFTMVMEAVLDAWVNQRGELRERAAQTRARLDATPSLKGGEEPLDPELVARAVRSLVAGADHQNGGFGGAPKFPPSAALDLLLTHGEQRLTERTLDAMAAGGIYDQLGGGFARYSVDAVWLVPHFEKMLYDNALLARSYLRGYLELGHDRYRRICVETLDWALAEMRGEEGGFYSALDADSEGVEGRYYTWSAEQARVALEAAGLDADPAPILDYLGITEAGNWEGTNVLHLPSGAFAPPPPGWDQARQALLARRAERVRPGLDDKRLTSWNALMIAALAEAGAALGERRYLQAASSCAEFLLVELRAADGHLLRTYNRGRAGLNAYLEDHAYLLEALLALYEASFEQRWFGAAREIATTMIDRFGDREGGGFFTTSVDHEQLIARRKDFDDHPIPSGNASAARGLLRLEALSGERDWGRWGEGVLKLLGGLGEQHPQGLAYLLSAADFYISPTREVALIAPAGAGLEALSELTGELRSRYRPNVVLAAAEQGATEPPLLAGRPSLNGDPAAYVCERFVCQAPVGTAAELADLLS